MFRWLSNILFISRIECCIQLNIANLKLYQKNRAHYTRMQMYIHPYVNFLQNYFLKYKNLYFNKLYSCICIYLYLNLKSYLHISYCFINCDIYVLTALEYLNRAKKTHFKRISQKNILLKNSYEKYFNEVRLMK